MFDRDWCIALRADACFKVFIKVLEVLKELKAVVSLSLHRLPIILLLKLLALKKLSLAGSHGVLFPRLLCSCCLMHEDAERQLVSSAYRKWVRSFRTTSAPDSCRTTSASERQV